MAELSEYEQKMSEWLFPQGWNDPNCLKYIAEEDIDSYEKHFSFDVLEHCKETFIYMEENNLFKEGDFKEDLFRCLPTADKELDYFLVNNQNWAVIVNSCRNTYHTHRSEQNEIKMAKIQQEIQNIRNEVADAIKEKLDWVDEHLGLLKEWDDPRHNKIARDSVPMLTSYFNKANTKKTGSNPKRIERDNNIRAEYDVLLKEYHDNHKLVREELAKRYPPLKPSTIKAIKYSIKDLM